VVVSNAFFVKKYLRKYNRSEVETFCLGRVWWKVDAYSVFSTYIVSRKCTKNIDTDAVLKTRVMKAPCLLLF